MTQRRSSVCRRTPSQTLSNPAPLLLRRPNQCLTPPCHTGAPRTFWIHKRTDGTVIFHYKEYSQDEVWAPFVDPVADAKVTLPEGIEIFATPPLDPAADPPEFVPLRTAV
jgi:hypothetical protein